MRDNIPSTDVSRFIAAFVAAPRAGEVYNLGGARGNSRSSLDAFALAERLTGKAQRFRYDEQHRTGDHICYFSDLQKMRFHYPKWSITLSLEETLTQIVALWQQRLKA